MLFDYFKKPEYLFRPRQTLSRLLHKYQDSDSEFEDVELPWRLKIRIRPADTIGRAIQAVGLYDLSVTETLWRLADSGEMAIDVGANIGHMTSVLAMRVGRAGQVIAYEPHPEIFKELSENIEKWRREASIHQIAACQLGLADCEGEALLSVTDDFADNRGTASLVTSAEVARQSFTVRVARLDGQVADDTSIGVLKIDVEGSELKALMGALALIRRRRIRDIVFEEHNAYPTPVTMFLEENGYRLYHLGMDTLGPSLVRISERPRHRPWDAPSCLATLDEGRALARLRPRGWQSLSGNLLSDSVNRVFGSR